MKEIFELQNLKNMSLAIFDNEELDDQTIKDTLESITFLLEEKSESILFQIKEKEMSIESMKNLGNYYLEKAKKEEIRVKKTKEIIKKVMNDLGLTKITNNLGYFSIRKNPGALIIENDLEIDAKYKEIIYTEKIKKDEIKKDIKNGIKIKGCYIEKSESLIIK